MARKGRPRIFCREEGIFNAMMLFWEQGFESTSIAQLRAAMGNISAGSFYTAFQSKESLFEEVVKLYESTYGQVDSCLKDSSIEPRKAIELVLRQSAKMETDRSHPLGCLVVSSASTCSEDNAKIREMLKEQREITRSCMYNCIQRAVDSGELPESTDVEMMTTLFQSFVQGISIQARDGVPFNTINAAITQILNVWDTLLVK